MKISKKLKLYLFVRNIEAWDLFEVFFVAAVAAVFLIRFFLELLNYPQLSPGDFHISHVLWGGVLMALALIVSFSFLNKEAKYFSALFGGVGFGVFIDQLGKFISKDNNYFFEPTFAFMYLIFVTIFLFARGLEKWFKPTSREYAINALEMLKEALMRDLDDNEKTKAISLLAKSNPKNQFVIAIKHMITDTDTIRVKNPSLIGLLRKEVNKFYKSLFRRGLFKKAIVGFFTLKTFVNLGQAIFALDRGISFVVVAQIFSLVISSLAGILGLYYFIVRDRLSSFEQFKLSVLVSVFLSQTFAFYFGQLAAAFGMVFNLIVLGTLNYMIHEEKARLEAI